MLDRLRSRWLMHAVVAAAMLGLTLVNWVGGRLAWSRHGEADAEQCARLSLGRLLERARRLPPGEVAAVAGAAQALAPQAAFVLLVDHAGAVTRASFGEGTDSAERVAEARRLWAGERGRRAPAGMAMASAEVAGGHLVVACTPPPRDDWFGLAMLLASAAAALAFALIGVEVVQRLTLRRLEAVRLAAERVSQGDLAERIADDGSDAIGQVGRAVDIATARLSRIVKRITQTAEALGRVAKKISDGASKVSVGAEAQAGEAHHTHEETRALIEGLRAVTERARAVSQDAREGAESAARISLLSREVAESVATAETTVDETAVSVTELARSISEVARRAGELASSVPQTLSSIGQMDRSIEQVRAHAGAAARTAQQVAADATRGGAALRETLAGVERIHETSAKVTEVTLSLESQIAEIGGILAVINELADRTNLLALNASIIAAQAGEHGRGFAVVASEIKDLARRTTQSIGEIGQLIEAVQQKAQAARDAVDDGARASDAGALQARAATALLSEILERVRASTQAAQAIADATTEQARSSAAVTAAMQAVADNVRQIAGATREQASGAGHIRDLSESLRDVVTRVGNASREQSEGAGRLAEMTRTVTDMVEALSRLQASQSQGGERIRAATAAIRAVADEHRESVAGVEHAVEELGKHAELLAAEIERFRIN
ncbi:MAG TPA: methyl-accepting chemotaxis protein [Polyangia bacterium]